MGLYQENINFRQAQGDEIQCPMVSFVKTVEDLIGTTAEALQGHEGDRNFYCYRKSENEKYSGGIPQVLLHAELVPEPACQTVFKELLRQIGKINQANSNDGGAEKRMILERWANVVLQNKHQETYNFSVLNTDVVNKVNAFAEKFFNPSLSACEFKPQNDVFNDNLEAY